MAGTVKRAAARRRTAGLVMAAATAAALLGALAPARGAVQTTLEECLRQGGHESGKYCSGGYQDGFLIG
ncbi:MAG: hypothetical protein LC792_20380 [Actinobacteria bacterium]|nr:hypothetical protein [Actinomycetota bacterium]